MSYSAIKLIKRPEVEITADLFEKVSLEIPTLNAGEFLIKHTHMSLDPAMKGWMMPDKESYIPPVEIGEVMRASGIGIVEESLNDNFPVGSLVYGLLGWAEYVVSDGNRLTLLPKGISEEAILSVLTTPGATAYIGLMEHSTPKQGNCIVVSGAAGSVGSLVGQIAKSEGMRVVGVAGTEEKCRWLTSELGFDSAINYKSDDFSEQLTAATPDGVDIFFENTGGKPQHPIFERMNPHGEIIVCGLIADYNTTSPTPAPLWFNMIKRRLTMKGFALPDHFHKMPEVMKKLADLLTSGNIKYRAHTIEGLDNAVTGLHMLFKGENNGKLILKL